MLLTFVTLLLIDALIGFNGALVTTAVVCANIGSRGIEDVTELSCRQDREDDGPFRAFRNLAPEDDDIFQRQLCGYTETPLQLHAKLCR